MRQREEERLALAPPETASKIMKPNTNTEAAETVQTSETPAVDPAATCSAFRFSFAATYPKDHNRCGGTFLEGDLEVDDLDDLPQAALAIFKDAVADLDMTGQTEIRFSILPNSQDQSPSGEG